MRLLTCGPDGHLEFTPDLVGQDPIPPYAILSHTWGEEEVAYQDILNDSARNKRGYTKILFIVERAKADNLKYFWVDTCCIDKTSSAELSTSINSMFKWYKNATKCYVYLSDVSNTNSGPTDVDFTRSRWFTRGWTLQELLAPASVQFYTKHSELLGDKKSLARQISDTTGIPSTVLDGGSFSDIEPEKRMQWADARQTKLEEDEAYSLFGILGVSQPILYGEGRERAFRRLRLAVRENEAESGGGKAPHNVHWLVPKTGSTLFTGRTDLLYRIQNAFYPDGNVQSSQQKCFVITGMGGQGKSEICIQVASLMREDFWGVFWVDLSNQSTARFGFLAIAKALGSSAKTLDESVRMLASAKQRWLLFLDNADDPTIDYAAYFPSGNRGAIIMTSRNPDFQQYSTVGAEALEGLDTTHSAQLLLKAARIQEPSWASNTATAQDIARLLGSHTLALIQAGAYISAGYCRLEKYAESFRQQRAELLEHHPAQQRSRYSNVYATFEASLDVLKRTRDESGNDALDLIGIISILHSSVLPLQLFNEAWIGAKLVSQSEFQTAHRQQVPRHAGRFRAFWASFKQKGTSRAPNEDNLEHLSPEHVSRLPSFIDAKLHYWDDYRLKRARALLVSLSLVAMHQADGVEGLSMHPLVHAWAKDRMDVERQQQYWISAGCIVALSRGISDFWSRSQQYMRPHLQALFPSNPAEIFSYGPHRLILPMAIKCGWILNATQEQKRLQDLLTSLYQVLDIKIENFTGEHMPVWRLAALATLSQRRNTQAISILESITTFDRNTLQEIDPVRLWYEYQLGRAYNDSGQFEKAVPMLEHVVSISRNMNMHPNFVLSTYYELHRAYNQTGRSRMSVTLLKRVVEEQDMARDQRTMHDQLLSQNALASAYIADEQHANAVKLLEHVVDSYANTLPELHPDRLGAQCELARAYASNDQPTQALKLAKHLVSIQENSVDQYNHLLLASQYFLAIQHLTARQFDNAVELLKHVVKMYDLLLDETQSERLSAKYALALAYVETGQADKALVLMRHVVEVRTRTLESEHPHRRASEKLLGSLEAGTAFD